LQQGQHDSTDRLNGSGQGRNLAPQSQSQSQGRSIMIDSHSAGKIVFCGHQTRINCDGRSPRHC
jgi:hypothetical protein